MPTVRILPRGRKRATSKAPQASGFARDKKPNENDRGEAEKDEVKVIKSIPLVAVLRKAQMARELVEISLFLCLIVFMALTVYKFLGTAQTRIEANGFLKICVEQAVNDANTGWDNMNYYGMSASDSWAAMKNCADQIIQRGIDTGPDGIIGTPKINDFQQVMMMSIVQTKRYVETNCSVAENVKLAGQKCYGLETFDAPGTAFGPGGQFKRQFLSRVQSDEGSSFKYNGSKGIWAYVEVLSYGPEAFLNASADHLQRLEDAAYFDELTYKISLDLVTYNVGYHEMNYVRLTFTRQTSDGGYRTAGFIPMIYSAPLNPLIRDWGGYKHPLPPVDYDPTQRKQDGLVMEIVYGIFLITTWYITMRDAGNSLVEEWIEQFNQGVPEHEAIGSLAFVLIDQTSGKGFFRRLVEPFTQIRNYINVWKHLLAKHFVYAWNLIDLASNCVMSLNIIFLSVAVAFGRHSAAYREMPLPEDTDWDLFYRETNTEMAYVNIIQYTAAVSMILAAVRMFRSLKDIPGIRVYSLLFYKAYPRLKDFFIFFILIIFFLSIAIFFVFDSTGGNPDFKALGFAFGTLMSQTFGIYPRTFDNSRIGSANNSQIIQGIMWLVIILLNVIALNILLAIIVDAYSFATDDEALNKEAAVMLEPSFLANAISYTYFLCSIPFEMIILPILNAAERRIRRLKKGQAQSFRIPKTTSANPGEGARGSANLGVHDEIMSARLGGSDGDRDDADQLVDRDGDGDVDIYDQELTIDNVEPADIERFEEAMESEDFDSHDVIDMRQVITGFALNEVEFKMRGTNSNLSVQFLKYFLDAEGIDRWDRHSRVDVYHPCFEGYGDSMVQVSTLAYTPGLMLFSLPSRIGFRSLPIILLEWKLSRDSKSETLLNFFEDATTNSLDDTVTDMTLTEDQLLDYYCKAVKAAAQEDLIIDEIVRTMLKTPAAIVFSMLSFELPLLLCHGYIFYAIKEQVANWFCGCGKKNNKVEPRPHLSQRLDLNLSQRLDLEAGPSGPKPKPKPQLSRHMSMMKKASTAASQTASDLGADPLASPEFNSDFDLLEVIMYVRDIANVYGRPHELQAMMKVKVASAVTQYAKWAGIPLHRMEEAGSQVCALLETRSMQKALNRVSWNMVTRMSKADQELRNKLAKKGLIVDDDEDTSLTDFIGMALGEYLEQKGWPGGLGDPQKNKIKEAIKLGSDQILAAVVAGTEDDKKQAQSRYSKIPSAFRSQGDHLKGNNSRDAFGSNNPPSVLQRDGATSHHQGGARIPSLPTVDDPLKTSSGGSARGVKFGLPGSNQPVSSPLKAGSGPRGSASAHGSISGPPPPPPGPPPPVAHHQVSPLGNLVEPNGGWTGSGSTHSAQKIVSSTAFGSPPQPGSTAGAAGASDSLPGMAGHRKTLPPVEGHKEIGSKTHSHVQSLSASRETSEHP